MGSKLTPGIYDCYARALPDEEMFTILARSREFWPVVTFFAALRERAIKEGSAPLADEEMVLEARQCALAGATWRHKHQAEAPWQAGLGKFDKQPNPSAFDPQVIADLARLRAIQEIRAEINIMDEQLTIKNREHWHAACQYLLMLLDKVAGRSRRPTSAELWNDEKPDAP